MKNKLFFQNKTALQTFLILVISFIVTTTLLFVLINTYSHFRRPPLNQRERANRIIQLINTAQKTTPQKLIKTLPQLSHRGIRVTIEKKALEGSKHLYYLKQAGLSQWIMTHPEVFKFSYHLKNGDWLNIRAWHMPPHPLIHISFLLSMIILVIAYLAILIWAIKRLSMPLSNLAQATKRFGMDINAAPLAETGPDEMIDLIHSFNQMQAKIKRLIIDRTQMLAAISHDLRTPITRLKLRAENFENSDQYEKIIHDLNEMENMISSVLLFAREDTRDEAMERFDLNALLDSLSEDMSDAGLEITYEGLDNRLPFFGRITSLKRAFSNLIENAVKYGKRAHMTVVQKDDRIQIEIEDEGPGIPADALEKVFEPFYRVEQSRSRETGGTGLGLVIAREAIRAHNGDITLVNKPSGGLKVIVTLPI